MKLDRVDIKNFRSIKEVSVEFSPECRVLVGINESGKSNILNALALLSDNFNPIKKTDMREVLPNEKSISEAYVKFIFKFEKNDSDRLFKSVSETILTNTKNPVMFSRGTKQYTLKEFCMLQNKSVYVIDILEEEKSCKYYVFDDSYQLLSSWKKPTATCPEDYCIIIKGESYNLKQYKLIRDESIKDIPEGYLEDAEIGDITSTIGKLIVQITKESLPTCLFWKYEEANLLPNSIKIAEFANNPDICIPLKNMFVLAGIQNIKNDIEEAQSGTANTMKNFLNRVAHHTTEHFKNVWKEHKNIEFILDQNGDQIVPGIKEKNTHDFARRSDGFKRFVTFLLMVSVNVKTRNLSDALILIDEPDNSLHPSGACFLRDELIKISKKNYVVYSTHSIFMIDSSDIGRHYIVKKNDEITFIEPAQDSNIVDEEVLYKALGYSVFEILKEKNIIFEGWRDKQLFRMGIKKANNNLQKKYEKIGICHAKGVKSIKPITAFLELAKRDCLIVSDCDEPAKNSQKEYKKEKGYGEWKTYQDIHSAIDAITGEDFIKNDLISSQVNSVISQIPSLPHFDHTLLTEKKGKLEIIKKWLIENGVSNNQAKDILSQIKDSIFEALEPKHIEDDYTKLLEEISRQFFE